MLKQIRKSIVGLVIGCTIISGSQIEAFAAAERMELPKTDVEIMIDIYEYQNHGITKSEEKMIRQYAKYKKVKKAGNNARKEHRNHKKDDNACGSKYYNLGEEMHPYAECCLEDEIYKAFPAYDKMSEQRQEIIEFVISYYFDKTANPKNYFITCTAGPNDDHNQYICDKTNAMYVGDYKCPCTNNAPVSKLTINGAKPAVSRKFNSSSNGEVKFESITEDDNYIYMTIGIGRKSNVFTLKINKNTRILESLKNQDGWELAD